MVKCVVIADDLTGANATGVMLKKMNYNTSTIMNIREINLNELVDCDCVTFTTDSRGVDAEIAYNRVYNVTKMCADDNVVIYTNRIDSTLRGNLGSETDAMLDALGEDYMAIAVPCAPDSGRVTIGGYMLVNGVPLSKTEAALDPKTPINDSRAAELFKKQTKYKVASIQMNDMAKGVPYVTEQLKKFQDEGVRIVVFDSIIQEDIDQICDAVIQSEIRFIAVDPGAFSAALARKLIACRENQVSDQKILCVVGSVNPVTKGQMEYLWLSQPVHNVYVKTRYLLEDYDVKEAEIERVVQEILEYAPIYEVLTVTGDGIDPDRRLNLKTYAVAKGVSVDDISEMINQSMAEITYRILDHNESIGGIYTCGGDVTAAVCRKLGTMGISLNDEVIPLAACGQFMDGAFPGKWIVTKGGMTGNPDAIGLCVSKLKTMLNM